MYYFPLIGEHFALIDVYYAMPYMPASKREDNNWTQDNEDHVNFLTYSKKIVASKYHNSQSYYYLFNEDLNSTLMRYLQSLDITAIVPIPSSHPLVTLFANFIQDQTRIPIIDCMTKVDHAQFQINSNTVLPPGHILLIDDITTSGSSIINAMGLIHTGLHRNVTGITVLCIGKTERDYVRWDREKIER